MAPGPRPEPRERILTRTDPPARKVPHRPPPVVVAADIGGAAVLKNGRRFLLSDDLGDVHPDARGLGLYLGDTRVLSRLELRLDGRAPMLLAPDEGSAAAGVILAAHVPPADGQSAAFGVAVGLDRSLTVRRARSLDDGLEETLTVDDPTGEGCRTVIELTVDADFADLFEVRGHRRERRGLHRPLRIAGDEMSFVYDGLDGRTSTVEVSAPGARIEPVPTGGDGAVRLRWSLDVPPGGRAGVGWSVRAEVIDPETAATSTRSPEVPAGSSRDDGLGLADRVWIESDDPGLDSVIRRGLADLELLITPGPGPGERYLAAGAPWFVTLFGRDAIHASLAALPVDPRPAVDTLRVMARLQATTDDPARDAEPGKMVHEIRDGEMARTGEVPFDRYYGAADATPLWLILLGETFDWTGDLDLVRELWPAARAALDWLDGHGDLDGDGFIEYRQRAPGGLANQGWKDAVGAIRDRHGRVAAGPVALVEVQAYAYDARTRAARLARLLGDTALADRLEAAAAGLRERFEAAFWVPDLGWYALALDGTKRPMDALASNQGHALWCGIAGPDRAASVARWLGSERMDSGWGLRSFGAGQPGYSALGYHTGSVWPHDTAIAVAGLRRYGQDDVATRLADGLLAAARLLPRRQLPELWCGFGRDDVDRPVRHPVACAPQAWAAAAPLLVLRAFLGLRPRAAEGRLLVERPILPTGAGAVVLRDLRVAGERVSLAFRAVDGGVEVEILERSGSLVIDVRP